MRYCRHCHETYEGEPERCPADGAPLESLTTFESELMGAELDGRFRLERLLGRGGMGTVYLGEQTSVGREVAIKILRSSTGVDESSFQRFTREAETMSELQHPNIVKLIDFGRDRDHGAVYLAMEYIRGLGLGDVLLRGRLVPRAALEILVQVCAALAEPHQRGIVHRDLKPENLRLLRLADESLQVKVLDFGIARVLENEDRLTETGVVCGTPAYMAPQQSRGVSDDPRIDLYSLGVILYEMLVGRRPFEGESGIELMLQHVRHPPPRLPDLGIQGGLGEDLQQLLDELLAKEPETRPASAVVLRDRVEEIRDRWDLAPLRLVNTDGDEIDLAPWIAGERLAPDEIEPNEADIRTPGEAREGSDEAVATTAAPDGVEGTDLYEAEAAPADDAITNQADRPMPGGGAAVDPEEESSSEGSSSASETTEETDRFKRWRTVGALLAAAAVGAAGVAVVSYLGTDDGGGVTDEKPAAVAVESEDAAGEQPARSAEKPSGAARPSMPSDGVETGEGDDEADRDDGARQTGERDRPVDLSGAVGRVGEGGINVVLAMDKLGQPAVALQRDGTIHFAEWRDGAWMMESLDEFGAVGGGVGLSFGPEGAPRVAVRQVDDNHIEIGVRREGKWRMSPVDRKTDWQGFGSLVTGPSGSMLLGYVGDDRGVWYAERREDGWHREKVISEMDGHELAVRHVETAVGPEGRPHLCAYDNTYTQLIYATKVDGAWSLDTYDADASVGRNCAIAVDVNGEPVFVFTRELSAAIKEIGVVRRTKAGKWEEISRLEEHPSLTPSFDIELDDEGHPRFTYTRTLDADSSVLRVVRWNGSRWLSTELTRKLPNQLPSSPIASLATSPDGGTHVAYVDREGLHYVIVD